VTIERATGAMSNPFGSNGVRKNPMAFAGFAEGTVQFLAELSRDNDGTWFEAHREDCERAIVAPAKQFRLLTPQA